MNIVLHAMRANCIFIEKESAIEGSVFDCRASTGAVRRLSVMRVVAEDMQKQGRSFLKPSLRHPQQVEFELIM